jgi:hypothetical protein
MKNNLELKKYSTTKVGGIKSSKEIKTFFGSKLIDIEDIIYVNNISIQYYERVDKINIQNDHYQNFDANLLQPERGILKSLNDVKYKNHSIDLYTQVDPLRNNPNQNYEWIIVINAKNILKEYLFLRLKESRVFKTIRSEDLLERNIDEYINNYIESNLLNRYNISELAFYSQYINVEEQNNILTNSQRLKNPQFNPIVFKSENRVNDVNIITPDYLNNLGYVKIIYNQIRNYKIFKFDYYYTITYKKI